MAINETAPFTGKGANYFRLRGIPAIDLATQLKGRDILSLTVSRHDGHPSRTLHAEVADMIVKEFLHDVKG